MERKKEEYEKKKHKILKKLKGAKKMMKEFKQRWKWEEDKKERKKLKSGKEIWKKNEKETPKIGWKTKERKKE